MPCVNAMPDPRRSRRWRALLLGVVWVVLIASGAAAQEREFSGQIVKVSEKRLVVDDVRFKRTKTTLVSDRRPARMRHSPREEWKDLRKGDWVSVEWRLDDKPRKAYRIVVLPPRRDRQD